MSRLAYSKRFVDLKPDLSDPSLVGAWDLRNADNKVVDLTKYRNNGVPGKFSIVQPTILGNFRRYSPNSGAEPTILGAANAFPLADLTLSFYFCWDGDGTTHWLINYYESGTDAYGIRINGSANALQIYDDIDNAGAILYSTTIIPEKIYRVDCVIKSLENFLYLDKELVGSGTLSLDTWGSFSGILYHGERGTLTSPTRSIVSPPQIYNEAKDADWIRREYLRGAKAIQFKTDYGVTESEENQTGGLLGGTANPSPLKIINGTWNISHKWVNGVLTKIIKNVTPGACYLPGKLIEGTLVEKAFGSWGGTLEKGGDDNSIAIMPIATASAAWNDISQNGYMVRALSTEELRLQRVTNGVVTANLISTAPGYIENNVLYYWWLTRRYDGLFTLYIKGGNYAEWTVVGSEYGVAYPESYHIIWDLDAGDETCYCDKINKSFFIKMLGVIEPSQLAM